MGIIIGLVGLVSALIFGIVGAYIVWRKSRTKKWRFLGILLGFIIGAIVGLFIGGVLGWLYLSRVI